MDPRVGVGVFVFDPHNPTRFVLGRRKGSHGAGTIALPGGHLDYGETFEQCAAREVLEETGLIVEEVEFLTATNSVFEASGEHYVTIFMSAKVKLDDEGKTPEPRVMEPDKCEAWLWSTFAAMREMSNVFQPLVDLQQQRPVIVSALLEPEA